MEEEEDSVGVISGEESNFENDLNKPNEKETKESFRSKYLYCADFPFSVWFIFANEFGERYCFYGFKAILALYLVKFLKFTEDTSTLMVHAFIFLSYLSPIFGGLVADGYLGKYWTIFSLSIVYCLGQSIISITAIPGVTGYPPHWWGILLGLLLVSLGTGGIKPCVSSFGGDQFGENPNPKLLTSYFAIYYMCINTGSTISAFLTPLIMQYAGYAIAFATPAAVLIIATIIFSVGYKAYKHVPPTKNNLLVLFVKVVFTAFRNRNSDIPATHWMDKAKTKYDDKIVDDFKVSMSLTYSIFPLFIFWALYDQYGTRWVFQAEKMNRTVGSYTFDSGQVTMLNSIFIITMVPFFDYIVYPIIRKFYDFKPLRRMAVGFIFAALSFICAAVVEYFVDLYPHQIHVAFQIPQYLIMCFAEILVSISSLEFAYSQAPASMKGVMAAVNNLTIATGNLLVVLIADLPILPKHLIFKQVYEFLFFAFLVVLFLFLFLYINRNFKYLEEKKDEALTAGIVLEEYENPYDF